MHNVSALFLQVNLNSEFNSSAKYTYLENRKDKFFFYTNLKVSQNVTEYFEHRFSALR